MVVCTLQKKDAAAALAGRGLPYSVDQRFLLILPEAMVIVLCVAAENREAALWRHTFRVSSGRLFAVVNRANLELKDSQKGERNGDISNVSLSS
jgi:hypothetical protein